VFACKVHSRSDVVTISCSDGINASWSKRQPTPGFGSGQGCHQCSKDFSDWRRAPCSHHSVTRTSMCLSENRLGSDCRLPRG
jgi:hypothetical protein